MPKPLLIVKNIAHEGPGLFEEVLKEKNVPYTIIDLNAEDSWPAIDVIGGMLVMGGPDSANDINPKMQTELEHIEAAVDRGLPYLGICLGLQTLVKAMGGTVRKAETREIGCTDANNKPFTIELTAEGKKDPLLMGLSSSSPIFQLHGETVELTPEMTLLATGKWCKNQIVKVSDRAYGIQGHWDLTDDGLQIWKQLDPDLQKMPEQKLISEWQAMREQCMAAGKLVFSNFLRIAQLAD